MFFLEIRDSKACGAEIWADIEGYEGLYQVSTEGRVRSLNYNHTGKPKILKPQKTKNGYLQVDLCKDGKQKMFSVHRLVAQAFLYCENRDSLQVNHKTEKKDENRVECIEWCNCRYNCNFGTRNQRSAEKQRNDPNKSKQVKQLTLDGKLVKTWPSTMECSRNGFDQSNVAACCRGKLKTHKGYKWQYA